MTPLLIGSDTVLECDLLVAGTGAAGMTAAITARHHGGLNVVVAEKESIFGGTTALSAAYLWVPGHPLGQDDDTGQAQAYIRHEAGTHFDERRTRAFLREGPRMVSFLTGHTRVRFDPMPLFPDYHPDAPGGLSGGRVLHAQPVRASILGAERPRLRPPKPELTLWGVSIDAGTEFGHFLRASRSLHSFAYVAKRLTGHLLGRALTRHNTWLTNGNALAARLYASARDLNIPIWLNSPVQSLITAPDGAVTGAWVLTPAGLRRVLARRGVVLACGGFSHDVARREQVYRHDAGEGRHFPVGSTGSTGDGLRLGESVGGQCAQGFTNGAGFTPVSLLPASKGRPKHFPHFQGSAKPGVIAVLRTGQRFVNEANSYHDFVQAMVRACPPQWPAEAFLIADHCSVRRYGLGHARPAPFGLRRQLRDGYLVRAATLADLARRVGIDPVNLQATIQRWNEDVTLGQDTQWNRGSTAYNRYQGDISHHPNPCLGAIDQPPYYALRVLPGDVSTFVGLRADEHARVLDAAGAPIPGLYVAGADAASLLGGNYSGVGFNIGTGMTFGFIAGLHAVQPPGRAL